MGFEIEGMIGKSAIAPEEREHVLTLIPEHGRMLEIGTLDGVTVAWWASERRGADFLSVDLFVVACGTGAGNPDRWKKNSKPNQRLMIGSSGCLLGYERSFDVAFIDGDHSYKACLSDLKNIEPMMRPNSPMCVHDYGRENLKHLAGVTQAVDEFCAAHGYHVSEVKRTTAILRRKV